MKIEQDVLKVLDRCTIDGPLLFLPEEPLDRKLYERVNKVLECLGGKWNRKAKAHVFSTAPDSEIEAVMLTEEVRDWRKELQFFPTPRVVADLLVDTAELRENLRILEPSAGKGDLAAVIRERMPEGCTLAVEEIHEPFCDELKTRGFLPIWGDFLHHDQTYDRIIANPPFFGQQDVIHATHMHKLLKPGGLAVSVMAAGVRFRENWRSVEFREMVAENGGKLFDLPDDSFKSSGTSVNTCVVVIPKL